MKKLLINRKPIQGPWGGGNLFVKAIHEHASRYDYEITHSPSDDVDVCLMVDPRYDELGVSWNEISHLKSNYNIPILHRVNECDARKGTNDMDRILSLCSAQIDATVFVSQWMHNYHLNKGWVCGNNYVIYNGVNHEHFKPGEKFKDGRTYLVTHHWSNNYMKGFDIYDELDKWVKENDDFVFTYIGRERGTFKNTKVIPPLFGEDLGKELGKHDIYISASRWDPSPNHIIESLACGLPTFVHKDAGGAVELVDSCSIGFHYSDFNELAYLLKQNQIREDSFPPQYTKWDNTWEECAYDYFRILDKLVNNRMIY